MLNWSILLTQSGPCQNIKTVFPSIGIPMLKIRRSQHSLIFNVGIPILVRRYLYTETAPRSHGNKVQYNIQRVKTMSKRYGGIANFVLILHTTWKLQGIKLGFHKLEFELTKRHPIFHPHGWNMGCLLWVPCISNIKHTKSPNLNVSHLLLQLSLLNPMKPGVKSRMKM